MPRKRNRDEEELKREKRRQVTAEAGAAKSIKDPITGLPVLSAGKNAPKLTSEQVQALLADLP